MAHVDVARHQHGLHRLGQVQQAQQVAGCAAATAHSLCSGFVRQAKFLDQALQALRFFQRVQVFALHVFYQRHGGGGVVGNVFYQYGYAGQPRQFGRPKAPLARDDFVFACVGTVACIQPQLAYQNRLQNALGLDGLGQFVQRSLVHARARLVDAGNQFFQQQRRRQAGAGGLLGRCMGVGVRRFVYRGAKQGFQAAA